MSVSVMSSKKEHSDKRLSNHCIPLPKLHEWAYIKIIAYPWEIMQHTKIKPKEAIFMSNNTINTYSFGEMINSSTKLSKKEKARLIKCSQYVKSICRNGIIDLNSDCKGEEKTVAISIKSIEEVAARGGSLDECEVLANAEE